MKLKTHDIYVCCVYKISTIDTIEGRPLVFVIGWLVILSAVSCQVFQFFSLYLFENKPNRSHRSFFVVHFNPRFRNIADFSKKHCEHEHQRWEKQSIAVTTRKYDGNKQKKNEKESHYRSKLINMQTSFNILFNCTYFFHAHTRSTILMCCKIERRCNYLYHIRDVFFYGAGSMVSILLSSSSICFC